MKRRIRSREKAGKRPGGSDGFTLIELLISITLIAVMASILFLGLHLGVTAWDQGQTRVDHLERTRSVLDQVSQEIQSCYRMRYTDRDLLVPLIAFHGTKESVSCVTATTGLNPERWNQPFREVTYFLGEDPETGLPSLRLREAALNMGKPFEEGAGTERTLIPNVERFTLSYLMEYLGDKGKPFLTWEDEAVYNDPEEVKRLAGVIANPEALPHAVRIELVLREGTEGEDEDKGEMKRVALPPVISLISDTREISLAATGTL